MSGSTLSSNISMLNGVAVGIFGMILSAAFCNIIWSRKKHLLMAGSMAGLLLLQGIVYFLFDYATVKAFYPVVMHIPLVLILCIFYKKILWPVVAVFTAYLCCELRRWLALLIVAIGAGGSLMQDVAELALTVPLLLLLLRFVAPSVRYISKFKISMQCQFGLIPVLGYVFSYVTQVYTNLFSKGAPIVAEFMMFICSGAYLVFLIRVSKGEQVRSYLEQTQDNLNLQVSQAVRQIELLRESQNQASAYRHDLRHHMQYLLACIENDRLEQAQTYIREICLEIDSGKVTAFCDNEAANLIFSAFVSRAEADNIPIHIKAVIPKSIPVLESDLCVLLSNALENALHACQKLKKKGFSKQTENCAIEVSAYEKNGKLFFQIINPCDSEVTFEKGIPVTNNPGHGIGVRSICALVERYGGVYSFSVKDGQFILRVSL